MQHDKFMRCARACACAAAATTTATTVGCVDCDCDGDCDVDCRLAAPATYIVAWHPNCRATSLLSAMSAGEPSVYTQIYTLICCTAKLSCCKSANRKSVAVAAAAAAVAVAKLQVVFGHRLP